MARPLERSWEIWTVQASIWTCRTRTEPTFFLFVTLVTGFRRSLSLKLSDTRVYEPQGLPVAAGLPARTDRPISCQHAHLPTITELLVRSSAYQYPCSRLGRGRECTRLCALVVRSAASTLIGLPGAARSDCPQLTVLPQSLPGTLLLLYYSQA